MKKTASLNKHPVEYILQYQLLTEFPAYFYIFRLTWMIAGEILTN